MILLKRAAQIAILLCLANEAHAQAIKSASGEPSGYYAGLSEYVTSSSRPDWQAWFNRNRDKIAEIQNNAKLISSGEVKPQCVNAHLYLCVASLASKLAVADSYQQRENVFHENPIDVNGKPLFPKSVLMDGFIPDAKPTPTAVRLRIDGQGARH